MGKQYSCDHGGAGKAITAVVVLLGKQYSCDHGGAGKAIQLWWCWWESNTVVIMVVQGR